MTTSSSSSGIYVAPLHIKKSASHSPSNSEHSRGSPSRPANSRRRSQNQITPPSTPNGSRSAHPETMEPSKPIFHNFLRAFYPFQPTNQLSTTVALPMNSGDIILVHSIHTTGWADGTLLCSGLRGWLPTNYCEAYDEEAMRNLLNALLNFWDIMRAGWNSETSPANSEPWRGIIAGVRFLLENTGCLTRESPNVQHHDALRKHRKALLSELSSLVKTSKRVTEAQGRAPFELTDELVLKAFKIVIRGVQFLDVWNEVVGMSQFMEDSMLLSHTEDVYDPMTPPAEAAEDRAKEAELSKKSGTLANQQAWRNSLSNAAHVRRQSIRNSYARPGTSQSQRSNRPSSVHVHRLSTSHRISYTGHTTVNSARLASERLSRTHDVFLSYLGSFIGRLHLQTRSAQELLITTQQSVASGRDLLTVVEAVWDRDSQRAEPLERAKDAMYARVTELALAARELVRPEFDGETDEGFTVIGDGMKLMNAATSCVKAAGECVAKTKFVIERIGDFELDMNSVGLGISKSIIPDEDEEAETEGEGEGDGETSENEEQQSADEDANQTSADESDTDADSHPQIRPQTSQDTLDKPLPNIPRAPSALSEVTSSQDTVVGLDDREGSIRTSVQSLLPPLPHLSDPLMSSEPGLGDASKLVYTKPLRADSIGVSSNSTHSTYFSTLRDSETSLISHTSTRASTPEPVSAVSTIGTPFLYGAESMSSSMASSLAASAKPVPALDESEEAEAKVLEKTFAHELAFNKEGQITGGTLPALIERLTTHDSTPDSMFVTTFYLTFRLFTNPVEFAEALVDRFDYVGESPHIANPVRLRVYNVFKGWMESHWRNDLDEQALNVILPFAKGKLSKHIPPAGKRLVSLAEKVSSANGALVPRLVSSIGKTNTSIAPYISADTPLPPAVLTKSQSNLLKAWRSGGPAPTVLDFDPLELARQLTIKESKIFCSILPEELLDNEWMKKSGSIAFNVSAIAQLSTDIAALVAGSILAPDDAKKRAAVIKHWVKVAKRCAELNNYDALMAIMASLESSSVARLKKTWEVVSTKTRTAMEELRAVSEVDRNFAALRQRLQGHVPPCMPFVGMYLTDLNFVNVGNVSTRQLPSSDGEGISIINFDKHMKTAKIIADLQRFQIPYRLAEVQDMQDWLQTVLVQVRETDSGNVTACYRRSLVLEPRLPGNNGAPTMSRKNSILPTLDEKSTSGGSSHQPSMFRQWTLKDKSPVVS